MIIVNYYNSVTDLRLLLEAYSTYRKVSVVSCPNDIPDFKADVVVVIGHANYKREWKNHSVHLLEQKDNYYATLCKIQKLKHYMGMSSYKATPVQIMEDRCKELSLNLEELSLLSEPMKLNEDLKPKRIPGS